MQFEKKTRQGAATFLVEMSLPFEEPDECVHLSRSQSGIKKLKSGDVRTRTSAHEAKGGISTKTIRELKQK